MSPLIRAATPNDIPQIVALLIEDAQARNSLDPLLWRLAADAPARIEKTVGMAFAKSDAPAREFWFVVETENRIVGVTHAMLVPVPPIYDAAAGAPGLLLDDCFTSADAPPGAAEALLAATETALRRAGAARLVASCPATGPLRPLYERHGYEPITLYMVRDGLTPGAAPSAVRLADAGDVSGIVQLGAKHRSTLAKIDPAFWHIHPEADRRFDAWMRRSLTFTDRDMLVAEVAGDVHGYVIAQPIAPLLVPAAHDIAGMGIVDDFYDQDFADVAALSNGGASGGDLLVSAEGTLARRGTVSMLVVCPAAWPSKISLLERHGYRTAKLWMLKR